MKYYLVEIINSTDRYLNYDKLQQKIYNIFKIVRIFNAQFILRVYIFKEQYNNEKQKIKSSYEVC